MKKFFSNLTKPCDIKINITPVRGHIRVECDDDESSSLTSALVDQYSLAKSALQQSLTENAPNLNSATAVKQEVRMQELCLFYRNDSVCGDVVVTPNKNFEYNGIKIELIGEIVSYQEARPVSQFCLLSKEIAPHGKMLANAEQTFPFSFTNVEKEFDSYRGIQADLKYYLKVTVHKSFLNVTQEQPFWVRNLAPKPENYVDKGIEMQVGLEKLVMLSIKYFKQCHECRGAVLEGRLNFHLVNVRIDKAEVSIKRRETTGHGEYANEEEEILLKHEVIDGTPARGEVVPIRIFLDSIPEYKLGPTAQNVSNKFSVQYFVHLALCDTQGHRFFKQRELILYRSKLDESGIENGTAQ